MKKLFSLLLVLTLLCGSAMAEMGVVIIGGSEASSQVSEGEVLVVGKPVKVDGNYRVELVEANARSMADQCKGNRYGYLADTENKSAMHFYLDFGYGTHAPMYVKLRFTNFKMENTALLERVDCKVVFKDEYEFGPAMKLQHNPDQTASDGVVGWGSTVGVEVEPLLAVDFGFLVSVPLVVLESNEPLVMYVTIDNDVYTIDLRENLVIF